MVKTLQLAEKSQSSMEFLSGKKMGVACLIGGGGFCNIPVPMGGKGGEEVRSEAIRWKLTLIGTLLIVTL